MSLLVCNGMYQFPNENRMISQLLHICALPRTPYCIIFLCIPVLTHETHNSAGGFSLAAGVCSTKVKSYIAREGMFSLGTALNQYITGLMGRCVNSFAVWGSNSGNSSLY